jgi:hypothetical protein
VDETDADGVWATGMWESKQAHAASLYLDQVKEHIARAMPQERRPGRTLLLDMPPSGRLRLRIVASGRVERGASPVRTCRRSRTRLKLLRIA